MIVLIKDVPGGISLTMVAWFLCICCGYMEITARWIDVEWNVRSTVIDPIELIQLPSLHTCQAAGELLSKVVDAWVIEE